MKKRKLLLAFLPLLGCALSSCSIFNFIKENTPLGDEYREEQYGIRLLEALDRYEKKENENPSIGIILCTSKNDSVVQLSTSRSISSTAISTYSTKLIDTKVLQKKLIEYQEIFDKCK